MNQTAERRQMPSADPLVPSKPAAPPQRLNEVVRRVKMELVSGLTAAPERGVGFNPYDKGSVRDVWGRRRPA